MALLETITKSKGQGLFVEVYQQILDRYHCRSHFRCGVKIYAEDKAAKGIPRTRHGTS